METAAISAWIEDKVAPAPLVAWLDAHRVERGRTDASGQRWPTRRRPGRRNPDPRYRPRPAIIDGPVSSMPAHRSTSDGPAAADR